jgi:CRISPR-associated protein Cas2
MVVMILEKLTPGLRGELSRWLLEPKPGVFIGRVSALVRDRLWERVQGKAGKGAGILIHTAHNEQGYVLKSFGETKRELADFEGITLIRVRPANP